MWRHSLGSSTTTCRHALQTPSAPHMISQDPSLRKMLNRTSWGSAAQSLSSPGADGDEQGFMHRRRRRLLEVSIAVVCKSLPKKKIGEKITADVFGFHGTQGPVVFIRKPKYCSQRSLQNLHIPNQNDNLNFLSLIHSTLTMVRICTMFPPSLLPCLSQYQH